MEIIKTVWYSIGVRKPMILTATCEILKTSYGYSRKEQDSIKYCNILWGSMMLRYRRRSFGSTLKACNVESLLRFSAVICYIKVSFISNTTPRYLNESTCSTGSPLMAIRLMTVLLRRKSMHISFVLETLRCRKLVLHQLEKCTTEETYDWQIGMRQNHFH